MSDTNNTNKEGNTEQNENSDKSKQFKESKISPEAEYGYYYYPERTQKYQWSFWKNFNILDRYSSQYAKCLLRLHESLESKISVFTLYVLILLILPELNPSRRAGNSPNLDEPYTVAAHRHLYCVVFVFLFN